MKRLLGLLLVMGIVGCEGGNVATPLPDPIENSIGMVLVPIPAGEFPMGSPETEKELYTVPQPHEVQHQVTLTKPFLLGVHEVTQGQWRAVMGTTPWKGKKYVKEGDDYPATYVNWDDAVEFCRQLSEKEGLEFRLPTEAEWEYACRAGTTTAYSFGADASQLGEYAWCSENTGDAGQRYAHAVGQKKPNPWGLYDTHGNVWELRSDRGGDSPSGSVTDPAGPSSGSDHVFRGGCWITGAGNCRSASPSGDDPSYRSHYIGFRVALSGNPQPDSQPGTVASTPSREPAKPAPGSSAAEKKPAAKKSSPAPAVAPFSARRPPNSARIRTPHLPTVNRLRHASAIAKSRESRSDRGTFAPAEF